MKNSITTYRRIQNWENFFMDSALYSVANSIGIEYDNGFTPIAAITGDLFTYMYSDKLPCDSGLTNYIVMPDVVSRAFASFGWDCEYISREAAIHHLTETVEKIRACVDRSVPVLAWGVGGVVDADGVRYDPMGEGALIGGYDDDLLLVHLYCGAERLAPTSANGRPGVDENGYTAISAADALATTHGLFIPSRHTAQPDMQKVCQDAIMAIPKWLTLSETAGYTFGKAAFERWAKVLLDDSIWLDPQVCTEETIWNKHCSAYCSLCTSMGAFGGVSRAVDYLNRARETCPALSIIAPLLPHYLRLSDLTQQIWDLHEGFMPAPEKMHPHAYREKIASILRQMGVCCDHILHLFASFSPHIP